MTKFVLLGLKAVGSVAVLLVQFVYIDVFGLADYGQFALLLVQSTLLGSILIYPLELQAMERKDSMSGETVSPHLKARVLVPLSLLLFTASLWVAPYYFLLASGAVAYLEYKKNQAFLRAKNHQVLAVIGEWLLRPVFLIGLTLLGAQFTLANPISIAAVGQILIALFTAGAFLYSFRQTIPANQTKIAAAKSPPLETDRPRVSRQYLSVLSNLAEGYVVLPMLMALLSERDFGSLMLLRQVGMMVIIYSISNEGRYRYLLQHCLDTGETPRKVFAEFRLFNLLIGMLTILVMYGLWQFSEMAFTQEIPFSSALLYSCLVLAGSLIGPYHLLVLAKKIDLAPFAANIAAMVLSVGLVQAVSVLGYMSISTAAAAMGSGFVFRRVVFVAATRAWGPKDDV